MDRTRKLSNFINRRSFSGALLLAPWAAALTTPAHAATAVVGQRAPDFSAPDTTGKAHRLSDYQGKLVVLEWTNSGCPFVRKHYSGNMQSLQKEFTAKGVVWLAVNSTDSASVDYLPPAQLASWVKDKQAAPSATLMDESGQIAHSMAPKPRRTCSSSARKASCSTPARLTALLRRGWTTSAAPPTTCARALPKPWRASR